MTTRLTSKRICARMIGFAVLLAAAGCGGSSNNNNSSAGTNCGGASGTGAAVTISGKVQYEDKDFTQDGFIITTSPPLKPIRLATVQVVRNCDKSVLSSAASDANGDYTVSFANTGTAGVYVSVLASAPAYLVTVKQSVLTNSIYAVISSVLDDSTGAAFTQNLTATTAGGGGVFNLLDVTTAGAEFVTGLAGTAPPPLTVYWSSGSCDGTYFNPGDNSIHVLGGCTDGDTDEYDDAVVMHEFGHFAVAAYSDDDSPGGIHYLNDNTQDIRLSWSEGWGDFFASAARNDPLYVDTIGSAASISFNLEDLSTIMGFDLAADAVYATNEISVAAVLWDIFDTTPTEPMSNAGGFDAVSGGMASIWDVVDNYLTCAVCGITNVSFEDFWDGWFARGHGFQAEMDTVVADRKMAFAADSFGSDGTTASATSIVVNGASQVHTFYPAGDEDYIQFTASSGSPHTVETFSLTNGTDTFLEVFGSDGTTLIGNNDNWDGKTYGPCGVDAQGNSNCPINGLDTMDPNGTYKTREPLSSLVQFNASSGTTYYVRVKRSSSAPPSAGVYGSYNIRVTSP